MAKMFDLCQMFVIMRSSIQMAAGYEHTVFLFTSNIVTLILKYIIA